MEYKKILGNTGVIGTNGTMIPVYRLSEKHIVMIDSGPKCDDSLIAALKEAGMSVSAVLCTHFHPDHTANNSLLVRTFGTRIFAPEADICPKRFEIVQYGNIALSKNCLRELPEYPIFPIARSGEIEIEDKKFEIIDTAGHTEGHLAYVTPDGVCCVGDAMISANVLQQLKLPYFECIKAAVESMKRLVSGNYPYYVISHCGVENAASISAVLQAFLDKREELFSAFRRVIKNTPQSADITAFMKEIGIVRKDFLENGILQEATKSYLSILADMGEVRIDGERVVSTCCRQAKQSRNRQ